MSRRAIAVLAVFALGASLGAYATASMRATPPPVVRDPLATANNPRGAKGKALTLYKVVIPAHAQLALHYHPGTQIAYVSSGRIDYTVKTGSVTVMTGPADGMAKIVRKIGPGQTGKIEAGEWIVEQPSTRHSSVNPTGQKTVIYLATLFPIGAPPAIAVPS
jgi:quercetin dioxygenase-like cupin family protein